MSHSENFKYKCDCEYCEKRRITCKKRYKPVTSPKKRGRKPKCESKKKSEYEPIKEIEINPPWDVTYDSDGSWTKITVR